MAMPTHQMRRPRGEAAVERTLFVGITAFRWAAWVWMAVTFSIDVQRGEPGSIEEVARPGLGYVLILVALAYTVWATLAVRTDPRRLDGPVALGIDLTIAMSLVLLDPWVYDSPHSQALGSNWAIATVLTAGVIYAGRGGFIAGFAIGIARWAGRMIWTPFDWEGDDLLAALSAVFIYALAGAVAGFFAIKLREAEREVAAAQAREEIARTLHDGVLQTLAVIQRRSTDDELVELARDQERDLRQFLFGATRPADDLATQLRSAAITFEQRYGGRAEVVIAGEMPRLDDKAVGAVAAAVAEALTNAAKHGGADHVTVYVEETDDGSLFCSVKDDGVGFDPAATDEGVGLGRSIRGRIGEVGGTVELTSRVGRGTEVRLTVPG